MKRIIGIVIILIGVVSIICGTTINNKTSYNNTKSKENSNKDTVKVEKKDTQTADNSSKDNKKTEEKTVKESNDNKKIKIEDWIDKTVQQPKLTKDSKEVKELFELYRIKNYDHYLHVLVEEVGLGDKTDLEALKLEYAVRNSFEKDLMACKDLEQLNKDGLAQHMSSCYESDLSVTNCEWGGPCKYKIDTKTRYATLENVEKQYLKMFDEKLNDEVKEFGIYGVLYNKDKKLFYEANHYQPPDLTLVLGGYDMCDDSIDNIKQEYNLLTITTNYYVKEYNSETNKYGNCKAPDTKKGAYLDEFPTQIKYIFAYKDGKYYFKTAGIYYD
ncbi:MAG: hypothetical protein IKQ35_05700 [Bacilli bacterium]|nr:hypothetical protein [Bacilli bacterium]